MLKTSELTAARIELALTNCFDRAPANNLNQMAKLGVHVFNPAAQLPAIQTLANEARFDMVG